VSENGNIISPAPILSHISYPFLPGVLLLIFFCILKGDWSYKVVEACRNVSGRRGYIE
jgi:hypothetical protein